MSYDCGKCQLKTKCCKVMFLPLMDTSQDYLDWINYHEGMSVTWKVVPDKGITPYVQIESRCENLTEDDKCAIHETRPEICRAYDCTKDQLLNRND